MNVINFSTSKMASLNLSQWYHLTILRIFKCTVPEKIRSTSHNALLPMGHLYRKSCGGDSDEIYLIRTHPNLRHVSSLSPHMTTCTKYPIGNNAWWEVLCIFSCLISMDKFEIDTCNALWDYTESTSGREYGYSKYHPIWHSLSR